MHTISFPYGSVVSEDDEINEVVKQVDTLFANGSNEEKLKIHTVLTEETAKVSLENTETKIKFCIILVRSLVQQGFIM